MRRAPGFCPTFGVTAKDVSSHTGFAVGTCASHVAPTGIAISFPPSQQTWSPFAVDPSTVLLSGPIRFCLLVILTHLKGKASGPLMPGDVARVITLKAVEELSSCVDWLLEPHGPAVPGVSVANPVYFSQHS